MSRKDLYNMLMDQPEACANCHTRLHPLEVSELYRGEKLDCHVCGYQLKAVATGAWTTAGAVAVGLGPWLSSTLFQRDSFVAELLIAVAVATIVWLAPPGLITGAPWVSIKAEKPKGTSEQRCVGATAPLREAPVRLGRAWFGHSK